MLVYWYTKVHDNYITTSMNKKVDYWPLDWWTHHPLCILRRNISYNCIDEKWWKYIIHHKLYTFHSSNLLNIHRCLLFKFDISYTQSIPFFWSLLLCNEERKEQRREIYFLLCIFRCLSVYLFFTQRIISLALPIKWCSSPKISVFYFSGTE
jgi:hypothetical protein